MRKKNRTYKHTPPTTSYIKDHLQDMNQRVTTSMINNGNPFIEEPDVQLSVAVIEEKPSLLTFEEPDVQLNVAVIEEPSSLTIEEPDVQLSTSVIEEKPSSFTIEESDAQPSAEFADETPTLFHYIYKTNVQLFKEVAELRKDIQILTQSINEVLQQDVRTEINPPLESLNRRYDYTSEQMTAQQQKIDEIMKLLYWKPRNQPGF